MSQKLPLKGFKWVEDRNLMKASKKDITKKSQEGYFLAIDIQHVGNLHNVHNDLSFLLERMNI